MFAWLALKAHRWFDHEFATLLAQSGGESLPSLHAKDQSEVRDRHAVTVNRVGGGIAAHIGGEVGNNLMAVEVEIDPFLAAAPLFAAHHAAVKRTRCGKVMDGKGEVEWRQWHTALLAKTCTLAIARCNPFRLDSETLNT